MKDVTRIMRDFPGFINHSLGVTYRIKNNKKIILEWQCSGCKKIL